MKHLKEHNKFQRRQVFNVYLTQAEPTDILKHTELNTTKSFFTWLNQWLSNTWHVSNKSVMLVFCLFTVKILPFIFFKFLCGTPCCLLCALFCHVSQHCLFLNKLKSNQTNKSYFINKMQATDFSMWIDSSSFWQEICLHILNSIKRFVSLHWLVKLQSFAF